MRQSDGFERQTEPVRISECAKIRIVRYTRWRLSLFWKFQIVWWTWFYVWGLLGSIPEFRSRPAVIAETTVLTLLMFLGSWILYPVCRWLLRRYPSWVAFELRVFGPAVVAGIAVALAYEAIEGGWGHVNAVNMCTNLVQFSFTMFMWCGLYYSVEQWQRSSQERERLLRAEAEAREARLQALRYQLNPHFLFNSLNAVSTLVLEGEATAATKMLSQIGDFLRTSLNHQTVEAPLFQEMAFTEQYIAIEKTRLGERLQVKLTISPDTLDALVPGMLLQPLVENAVRHGVANIAEGGRIAIESALHGSRLRILVRNSGRRGPAKAADVENGIGKRNIAERLRTLYGNDHQFWLEWPEAGGCIATLEIPMRKLQPQEVPAC